MNPNEAITVMIPTSPIRSHPSTEIIDQTIASIRYWLPEVRIVILADGVRPEQESYKARYAEYLQALHKATWQEERLYLLTFNKHRHQVGMTRSIFPATSSPLIMYCEHDCPLVIDRPIDWQGIVNTLLSGDVNCVRFHYESRVTPYHLYLFEHQFESHGVPLWATRQWCQRPHVATVELYKKALSLFSAEANTMIEDRLITFVEHAPWDAWRVAVYNPPDSMHRSLHLDGRGADSKFETEMRF